MEIDGINFSDITDIQDLLATLEVFKIEYKTLNESLSNNHTIYSKVSKEIESSTSTQKGIIDGITNLQIQGKELITEVESLKSSVKSDAATTMLIYDSSSRELLRKLEKEMKNFKKTLADTINEVDLTSVERQVIRLFEEKILTLEQNISMLQDNISKINKATQRTSDLLTRMDKSTKKLESADARIDKLFEEKSNLGYGVSFVLGIIIGSIILTFFKIDALSNYYFSKYDQEIAVEKKRNDELESKVKKLTDFQSFLLEKDIPYFFGKFSDSKKLYVAIGKAVEKKIDIRKIDSTIYEYVHIQEK